jgi:hypothetical protein
MACNVQRSLALYFEMLLAPNISGFKGCILAIMVDTWIDKEVTYYQLQLSRSILSALADMVSTYDVFSVFVDTGDVLHSLFRH